jgi:hypothetical protein
MALWPNLLYFDAGHKMETRDDDSSSHSRPSTPSGAEPKNALGYTWSEYEQYLRERLKIVDKIPPKDIERRIRMHREMFDRQTGRHPAAEERQRLFDAAYEATRPELRPEFVREARKSWA